LVAGGRLRLAPPPDRRNFASDLRVFGSRLHPLPGRGIMEHGEAAPIIAAPCRRAVVECRQVPSLFNNLRHGLALIDYMDGQELQGLVSHDLEPGVRHVPHIY
jgi:hypothetical protein